MYQDASFEEFSKSKKVVYNFTYIFFGFTFILGITMSIAIFLNFPENPRILELGVFKYLLLLFPNIMIFIIFSIFNPSFIRAFYNKDYHTYNNNLKKYEQK